MGIYDEVTSAKPQGNTPGLEATVAVDTPELDNYGLLPDPTPQAYASLSKPNPDAGLDLSLPAVNNPRTADLGTDIGGQAGKIVRLAQSFVGTPYVWGGSSPSGFDCSGFVQYVYRKVGINLPRVSYQQANAGQRVALKNLQPGDLVAWDNSSRNVGADHIAIYLGSGQIAEAPRPGVPLRVRSLGNNEGAMGVRILGG